MKESGMVYLVGAGPGDPGLFTLKGRQLLERAEAVVYDRLVSPEILAWANPAAEMIYVGKSSGHHSWPQEDINKVLLEKAAEGKMVVRLKGGDPFVFGRGGEEAEYLLDSGHRYEVVPGVTSAIAAPAYAGIPVTHRDLTSSLAIITGHEKPGKTESSIHWDKISTGIGTLVFLMGLENLPFIVDNLITNGRAAETPAAVIHRGTLPEQQVVEGTLDNIVKRVAEAGLKPPSIIVVGETAALRPRLKWLENQPLRGKKVLVTRARAQASALSEKIRSLGGQAIEFPSIEISRMPDLSALHQAFERLADYQWLCFTSVNGVNIFFDEFFGRGFDIRGLAGIRLAAIGPATADRLRQKGLRVDVLPDAFKAEELAAALLEQMRPAERLLLPRAQGARDVLPQELRSGGMTVDEICVYEAKINRQLNPGLRDIIAAGGVDYITFTSSSTVRNFVDLLGADALAGLKGRCKIACIGPVTANTARELGLTVDLQAAEYTIDELTDVIVRDAHKI
ncbi:MAG: uroporphyrinogen-III C-methyltransferase [Syntrophomonadaceae bacterium]|nr:uroporphyrinogen-III C-methyltransferase [Syntrophomonadaceae bacterium]